MQRLFYKAMGICLAAFLLVPLLSGCKQTTRTMQTNPQEESTAATEPARVKKEGIQTLLISCLEPVEVPQTAGTYRNESRSDFCLLLVIDEKQGKTSAIQLDPGTMVSFRPQGAQEAAEIPLGMVFSYGSGGSDSCLNHTKVVSGLLGGISIDHYMTFTLDSLPIVNDFVGGVTVPAGEDLPDELSGLVQEGFLTLSGEQTAAYFTYRGETDRSNAARMERQNLYIAGLYTPFLKNAQDENFLTKLTLQLGDRLSTDLTLSQMVQMMDTLQAYELDETVVNIQGASTEVDGEFQFRADPDSLSRVLDDYLYQ